MTSECALDKKPLHYFRESYHWMYLTRSCTVEKGEVVGIAYRWHARRDHEKGSSSCSGE